MILGSSYMMELANIWSTAGYTSKLIKQKGQYRCAGFLHNSVLSFSSYIPQLELFETKFHLWKTDAGQKMVLKYD